MNTRVCFVTASGQNVFFGELIDVLMAALRVRGLEVERAVDHFPAAADDLVYVFIPHEFMPLVAVEAHPSEIELRRTIAICTEQPGTHWFDVGADVAARAGAALDLNRVGVTELGRRGVRARFIQLGYVPEWDHWGGDPATDRPVELTFMGGFTERRAQVLARCSQVLAGRRHEIHLVDSVTPHLQDSRCFVSGERKWATLRATRVMLNVHRRDLPYFEWLRAVGAMANGCVVLSEESVGFDPLIPGEHFVPATFDSMHIALEALLSDPQRLSQISCAAYQLLREELDLARSSEVLAEAVGDLATRPLPRLAARRYERRALPRKPPARMPEFERVIHSRNESTVVRMGVKELVLGQRRDRQRPPWPGDNATNGDSADEPVLRGPRDGGIPRVSVVLTVYNYGAVVADAIESVAASDLEAYELVIVDDASTDHSPARIDAALLACPWVTATVIRRRRNGGLPAARNLGVQHARGEFVFILDADNTIFDTSLSALLTALDSADPDVKFAYGIIEQFRGHESVGLLSWQDWDPGLLRFGNFIDAMAMIRRSALIEAGGYSTDPRLYGWEDLELWCAFADRGWHGVRLPSFVARYRAAAHSMISLTNLDSSEAWAVLLNSHPSLST